MRPAPRHALRSNGVRALESSDVRGALIGESAASDKRRTHVPRTKDRPLFTTTRAFSLPEFLSADKAPRPCLLP